MQITTFSIQEFEALLERSELADDLDWVLEVADGLSSVIGKIASGTWPTDKVPTWAAEAFQGAEVRIGVEDGCFGCFFTLPGRSAREIEAATRWLSEFLGKPFKTGLH